MVQSESIAGGDSSSQGSSEQAELSRRRSGYFESIEGGRVTGWLSDAAAVSLVVRVNGIAAATIAPERHWPVISTESTERRTRFEAQLDLRPGDRVEVFDSATGCPLEGGVRSVVDPHWRPRMALVAPAKQEAPYLLEWIAYHRALGVETFIIGDNGGSDRTSELLQALDNAGVIQRLDWRHESKFQLRFDAAAIERARGQVDVCSVTDVDEFLRPLGGRSDIGAAVAEIFSGPGVSAAGLAWAIYGTSGRVEAGPGLVIERFTRRGEDDHDRHRTVKTMLRPEHFEAMMNPHRAKLTTGEYVNDRGDQFAWRGSGSAEQRSWNSLRVDHFVLKSRREFEMKAKRGDINRPVGYIHRDEEFFVTRDRNEVLDPMPAEFVERTKQEMARLLNELGDLASELEQGRPSPPW